ncbi:MAG TPA: PP0621 family protein [Ramlibacter sp.]|nr:PP0621 family protein [Ramlibacter sp.]
MKFLLIAAVILAVLWLLRSKRRADPRDPGTGRQAPAQQQEMVQCPVCRVHLPRADALPGPNGQMYCCADHRLRAEA